jgi:hypothetical protein
MVNIGQVIPLLESKELEIPAFQSSNTESFSQRLAWDSNKYKLKKATLNVRAMQTYLSGAKLEILINGKQRLPINWNAFETLEQARELDVTSSIVDGDNTYKVTYSLGFGAVTPQKLVVSATINLQFDGQRDGTSDPVVGGGIRDDNFWSKLGVQLRDNATLVVVGVVATAASVAIIKSSIGRTTLKGVRDIFK